MEAEHGMRLRVDITPKLPIGEDTTGIEDLLKNIGKRITDGNTSGKFIFTRSYTSGWSESVSQDFKIEWQLYE
jgi:hypothetical protein